MDTNYDSNLNPSVSKDPVTLDKEKQERVFFLCLGFFLFLCMIVISTNQKVLFISVLIEWLPLTLHLNLQKTIEN